MEPMEDLAEGVGESVSPPRGFPSFNDYDVRDDVYNRLVESGHPRALTQPDFRDSLVAHFNRLPASYGLDVNLDRVEEVLLHQDLLERATDPVNRPVYHIRFVENVSKAGTDDDDDDDDDEDEQGATSASTSKLSRDEIKEGSARRDDRNFAVDFEPCSRLGDLNLDVKKNTQDADKRDQLERFPKSQNSSRTLTHEVIFSSIDKPKLLSQLSALLSDIGLNIREAHVFSTTDGYSLDVFVVDGWHAEETDSLYEAMEKAIAKSEGSWSKSSHSYSGGKMIVAQEKLGSWEIDWRLLNIGERIGSGSCGDLHHGIYHGEDVAVKVLRSENLNDALKNEFAQELSILREVHHRNVVRFIGACTKSPHLCIVTEYMPGGSLYDYLHKSSNALELPELLKFAIHVSKGMEYLHHNDIIHRDLKTANLLMDGEKVVKVADFGVARFQTQGGVMTAETGTYRWMAPEVINHQPYDQKADVFSFAIVLWELITAKVPYDTMTPLQAALGVRQGLRPEIPANTNPKLLAIMQRCWDTVPSNRPTFSEVAIELETLLQEVVADNSEAADGGNQL